MYHIFLKTANKNEQLSNNKCPKMEKADCKGIFVNNFFENFFEKSKILLFLRGFFEKYREKKRKVPRMEFLKNF